MRRITTDERGFTLMELLLVMLIIAILAAVAIPSFLDQQNKAHDAAAATTLATAYRAMEIYRVDHGSYCSAHVSDLAQIAPMLGQASSLSLDACSGSDPEGYTLTINSASQGNSQFELAIDGAGALRHTCSPAGKGGCHSDGSWG
jgi:prepilin-type N-terminal cleavage/methylation domain-containing protein